MYYASGNFSSNAFKERRKSPKPPKASTKITIKSNDVIVLNEKRIDEITPNINPVIDPKPNTQPNIFRLL